MIIVLDHWLGSSGAPRCYGLIDATSENWRASVPANSLLLELGSITNRSSIFEGNGLTYQIRWLHNCLFQWFTVQW